jgi:hypothetical protein
MFALFNRKIAKVASVEKLFRYSFCWNIRLFGVLLHITIKHIKIKENNYYCSKSIFFLATENILLTLYGVLMQIILRNIKIKKINKRKKKRKEKKSYASYLLCGLLRGNCRRIAWKFCPNPTLYILLYYMLLPYLISFCDNNFSSNR